MAGSSDIRAGGAFIEFSMKGGAAVLASLDRVGQRLKSFGAGVSAFGGIVAAAGASILAPLAACVNSFSDIGSALADMSARTGIAGSVLAELGYAADMTGASLDDVGGAVGKMQKLIASGSKASIETLRELGLSLSDLKGLSPDKQFEAIAAKIAAIQDPTRQAAMSMETFGKKGATLLPMIKSLDELRQAAREKGLVPSDESIAAADEVGDAMDDVKKSIGSVVYEIGYALSGAVVEAATTIRQIIKTARDWVAENQGLVRTIAAVGVGLMAAGAIIVGLGTSLAVAGMALSGIAAGLGVVGSVIGAILSPVGLVVAALVGGVAAWALFTDSGRSAVTEIQTILGQLLGTARTAFGGIVDALRAGDLSLAAKVAWAGLQAVWAGGIAALNEKWEGWKSFFLEVVNQATANIAGAFTKAWYGIQSQWIKLRDFFADLWDMIVAGAVKAWRNAQNITGRGFLDILGQVGVLDAEGVEYAKGLLAEDTTAKNPATDTARDKSIAEREAQRNKDLGQIEADKQGALGAIEGDRQRRSNEIEANRRKDVDDAHAEAAKAQAELDRLTKAAADAAAAVQADKDARNQKIQQIPDLGDGTQAKRDVIGTFNASALMAQGGASPVDRQIEELRKANDQRQRLIDLQRDTLNELRQGAMIA